MRRENDAYFTPASATEQLVKRIRLTGVVCEPCVGERAIADVVQRESITRLITNDLDRKRTADYHEDAANFLFWQKLEVLGGVDWVVTNPPFLVAVDILKYAHAHARKGVAMLLRLSILEPCNDRGEWLQEHPPTRLIVLPRISFTGDGKTDSVTLGWCVWQYGAKGTIDVVAKRSIDGDRQSRLLDEVGA